MRNIATLAARAVEQNAQQQQPSQRSASPLVRKLFVMLHGAYGNQFTGKFSAGKVNKEGEDLGTRAAMLVWESALTRFAGDVVEIAARRLVKDNPKFPFNLGELEAACEAATPRQTFDQEQGLPRLAAPVRKPVVVQVDKVGDGLDWARIIEARAEAGDTTLSFAALRNARAVLDKLAKMNAPAASEGELLQEGGAP